MVVDCTGYPSVSLVAGLPLLEASALQAGPLELKEAEQLPLPALPSCEYLLTC